MNPPDSVVAGRDKKFAQAAIIRINEMPEDVNLQILHMRGDFDARHEVHTGLIGFCRRYRKTLQGIVIGYGQNRDIAVLGEAYQLLRREDTVRSSRMGVQVDQAHGTSKEWLVVSGQERHLLREHTLRMTVDVKPFASTIADHGDAEAFRRGNRETGR